MQPDIGMERKAPPGQRTDCKQAKSAQNAESTRQRDRQYRDQDHVDDFGSMRPGGALKEIAQQDLFDQLGVDRHARNRRRKRRWPQILEPGGAGADQHDMPVDQRRLNPAVQHRHGGDKPVRHRAGIMQPHPPAPVDRHGSVPDTDTGIIDDIGRGTCEHANRLQ